MARPRQIHPTPNELEILQILWNYGPCTVRETMAHLDPQRTRAYTSVMSLMSVMTEKGLLTQKPKGRAFIYTAKITEEKTQGHILKDILSRVFQGSATSLVTQLFEQKQLTEEELNKIQAIIEQSNNKRG